MNYVYTASRMLAEAGRTSPTSAAQLAPHLPTPDVVVVSSRPMPAWTLTSWRRFALTRRTPLRQALLETIERLRMQEQDMAAELGRPEKKRGR